MNVAEQIGLTPEGRRRSVFLNRVKSVRRVERFGIVFRVGRFLGVSFDQNV